jgi:hypothetical protein
MEPPARGLHLRFHRSHPSVAVLSMLHQETH